jgi:3-dehydroquinate dehydratase
VITRPTSILLGTREPRSTARPRSEEIDAGARRGREEPRREVECFQSNHEGVLVERSTRRSGLGRRS